jgi:hypothetical protein
MKKIVDLFGQEKIEKTTVCAFALNNNESADEDEIKIHPKQQTLF